MYISEKIASDASSWKNLGRKALPSCPTTAEQDRFDSSYFSLTTCKVLFHLLSLKMFCFEFCAWNYILRVFSWAWNEAPPCNDWTLITLLEGGSSRALSAARGGGCPRMPQMGSTELQTPGKWPGELYLLLLWKRWRGAARGYYCLNKFVRRVLGTKCRILLNHAREPANAFKIISCFYISYIICIYFIYLFLTTEVWSKTKDVTGLLSCTRLKCSRVKVNSVY